MSDIKQLRYISMTFGIFLFVRAFFHSFEHGYDLIFDVRILQSLMFICTAYLIAAIQWAFKPKPDSQFRNVPYFQSLDIAPAPEKMEGGCIYIKDYARLYYSDGQVWIPL